MEIVKSNIKTNLNRTKVKLVKIKMSFLKIAQMAQIVKIAKIAKIAQMQVAQVAQNKMQIRMKISNKEILMDPSRVYLLLP